MLPALLLSLAAAPDPLAGLDAVVAKGLAAHKVPGLSIAVVKDGKVVHLKGYGVRTVGKTDPVTERSLFAVGSVSKSFTAAALAMLVDDGKLTWDTRLSDHLPDFRLKDAYRTREVTVRDALSHRTGYARNDLVWYGSPFDRGEVLKKMRVVEPEAAFRTRFIYNNIMFTAAGELIPAVTGDETGWDQFVADRLFKPLKMTTASTSVRHLPKDGDVATPHEKVKGKPAPVPWRNIDNAGPAGAVNASAADMAEYLKFQLSQGKGPDKRLVKRDVFEEMHRPQTLIGKPAFAFNPEALSRSYGLGWFLSDHKGKRVIEHGGNIDGMTAQVGMLPDEKLGVVILANAGQSLLPQSLLFDLFDRFLGEPDAGRVESSGVLSAFNGFAIAFAGEPDEKARVKDTKPRLALEKYAGKYQDDRHAPAVVTHADGKLTLAFNGWTFDLEHWHYDTFRGKERAGVLPGILFTFVLGGDGKPAELRTTLVAGDEFKFARK